MECSICVMQAENAGSELYHDDHWVGMVSGDKPGWIMLAARRHADWTWSLDAAEAASLGPAVSRLSAAIRKATATEKVYLVGLGENSIHCHFLLMPRIEAMSNEIRAAIRKWGAEIGNAEESQQIGDALRAELDSEARQPK